MKNIKNKEIKQYISRHACYFYPAALRCQPLSVDFSRSGIWGKHGTGVQGICLKSCAKFPPNRTMCSIDAIRPQPFHEMIANLRNNA